MADPEELSREELIERVRRQDERIAELEEANEQLAARLARLERLLSRNSQNSSVRPSRDDEPGKTPPGKDKRGGNNREGSRRRGKQPGAPGSHLGWSEPGG